MKDKIKYVYTTEYGTERVYEDRRGTHVATLRPHYHLMLFVTDLSLTPETLNGYVGKLWSYGFHGNGKSFAELRRNTFTSGMNPTDTKVRLRGLANYIGKYMHKSSEYEDKIESRILAIAYKMCPRPDFGDGRLGIRLQSDWKKRWKICFRDAYSKVATFHGQSQHFGEYALLEPGFDLKEVAGTGKMRMPDKKKVVKFIPIPLYYRRKLFYEQVMKDDGKLMWKLRDDELSRTYYRNMTYRQSAILADVYANVYDELELADRIKVDAWMNGRTMKDLATYDVFFKDCYFDCDLADIGTDEALEIRLQQDFTKKEGNECNDFPLHRICQDDRFDFRHFDSVLKVFEPYLQDRHERFNEVFHKKEQLEKTIKR